MLSNESPFRLENFLTLWNLLPYNGHWNYSNKESKNINSSPWGLNPFGQKLWQYKASQPLKEKITTLIYDTSRLNIPLRNYSQIDLDIMEEIGK